MWTPNPAFYIVSDRHRLRADNHGIADAHPVADAQHAVPVHGNQAALGGTGDAVGAVPHGKFPSYAARHGSAAASPGYPDVRNAERTEAGAVNRVAGIQEPPGIPIVEGMQADGPAAEHGFPGKINQLLHAAPPFPFLHVPPSRSRPLRRCCRRCASVVPHSRNGHGAPERPAFRGRKDACTNPCPRTGGTPAWPAFPSLQTGTGNPFPRRTRNPSSPRHRTRCRECPPSGLPPVNWTHFQSWRGKRRHAPSGIGCPSVPRPGVPANEKRSRTPSRSIRFPK